MQPDRIESAGNRERESLRLGREGARAVPPRSRFIVEVILSVEIARGEFRIAIDDEG